MRKALSGLLLLVLAAMLSQCSMGGASTVPDTATGTMTPATEAAVAHHWGPVVSGDEFERDGPPDRTKWVVHDSVANDGKGVWTPGQVEVRQGRATIRGTADGTTGAMAALFDRRRYGRWEVRLRVAERDARYRPRLSLWPDSGKSPCDGAIDYAAGHVDLESVVFSQHYSCADQQTNSRQELDMTKWHNYAVEWTSNGVVGYVDGKEWFRDMDPSHQPPGPMHQMIQLEWLPDGMPAKPTSMDIAWVRVYDLPSVRARTDGVHLAAVGDMNPERNVARTSPSAKVAASITSALAHQRVDAFLGLGDFQYSVGRCADYVAYWNVLWSATKPDLYWVSAPNHDWQPGRNEDLDDFMNGACPGDPVKSAINSERGFIDNGEPYAKDFRTWHVVFLSSALWRYDPDRAQQITTWLDQDLAKAQARGQHLAVVHHEPYYTSDTSAHGRATEHRPWIEVMHKYRVRLTLSGSQHNYERTCPVDNRDNCVADGITAFQVSTGGVKLRNFTSTPPYIEKRFADTHGWLELILREDGSFDWEFHSVDGPSSDSGSRPTPS